MDVNRLKNALRKSTAVLVANTLLLMLSLVALVAAAAAAETDFLVYGTYTPGYSVYAVEGYGDLLYYDDGAGVAHIVRVSIPQGADPNDSSVRRTFTELATHNYRADIGWSGSGQHAEFYVDQEYIYYGPTQGIEKWAKNPDGTFGPYLGKLNVSAPGQGETLAYDAVNGTWYTGTSSRAISSFKVGVDTQWTYQFTYPSYGGGQGHHGGMEFVGGYLWVSEMKSDVIGQWQYVGSGPNNGWQEVKRFSYTQSQNVEGLGFGPLGHFWASGGPWKTKQSSPSVYEIGGGPTKLAVDFTWTPQPQSEGSAVTFAGASAFWPDVAVSWDWDFGDGATSSGQNSTHIYVDNGAYSVALTAMSANGARATTSHSVSIINVAPSVEAGADRDIEEGGTAVFSGSFTDPGHLDTHVIEWDFGDGSSASGTLTPTHVYGDNGSYTVKLTVTDDDGGAGSDTLVVTVRNLPPTVEVSSSSAGDEGRAINFSARATDQGSDDLTFTWDWGDGTAATVTTHYNSGTVPDPAPSPLGTYPFSASNNVSHIYGDNGVYMVTVKVADDDGGVTTGSLTVTVNNVVPLVEPGGPYSGDEGGAINVSASATDQGSDDLTFTWDWGDGTPATVTTYFNNGTGVDPALSPLGNYPFSATNSVQHTYGDSGVFTVTLRVSDDDQGVTTKLLTVTVNNVVPLVEAGGPYSGDEGGAINVSASATDRGSDDLTFTWDWGDGTAVTVTTHYNDGAGPDSAPSPLGTYPFSASSNVSHIYGDNGVYTVTLAVSDDDQGVTTAQITVQVRNIAPVVDAGPDLAADEGQVVNISTSFTDPGWLDVHAAEINWGDGTVEPGVVVKAGSDYSVTGSHVYSYQGAYSVKLTVADDDGGLGKDALNVFVPVGMTVLVEPGQVPSPSNAQYISLRGIPLQNIPLQNIPLQDIPLQDISLGATPLQDIPLQDIPLQDIDWRQLLVGTALESVPLQDITIGDLKLAGIPLQDITLADIFLAGIPLQDISIGAAPLQDIPLQDIPLQDISWQSVLQGTPLQGIPLQDITLRDLLLADVPLQDIPLQDINLLGTPLQYIPLQDIPLQDITWQSILLGTPLQDIPLQDITLGDIVLAGIPLQDITLKDILLAQVPLQDIPLQDIPLQDINIAGTPLQDIPLQDIPLQDITWNALLAGTIWEGKDLATITLGDLALAATPLQDITLNDVVLAGVPLQDIPLQDIPLQDIGIVGTPLQDIPLQDIPLQDITWQSILLGTPLQDIPLQDITLGALVLAGVPLQDITLEDIVLAGVPLQDIPLQDIPIVGTPLQDIPLQDISADWPSLLTGTVFEGANLATTTLGDIALAGIPLQDITLRDALMALIPLQDIPWESVSLQDLPLSTILTSQNTVTYTVTLANYSGEDAMDVAITHTLPQGFTYVAGSTTGATTSEPAVSGQSLTWGALNVPKGSSLVLRFKAFAALVLGTYFSDVSATSNISIPPVIGAAPVDVVDTFEYNDSWNQAHEVAADRLYISYIGSESDVDWYRIPVPLAKGTMVSVYMSHLPADYDLVLFAGAEGLPRDMSLQNIPLQDIPLQDIPLQDIPLQDIPLQDIPLQDIPLQDIPLQDIPLQDIPLQDISLERGTLNEVAADKVVNETGYYYILISGYNGAHSSDPYVLRIKVTPPPPIEPLSRQLPAAGPAGVVYQPFGADTETLIVTNQQRLAQYYGDEAINGTNGLRARLEAFADLSNVKGMILPVDSDAAVQSAYAAWDTNAGDPEAANAVTEAIRSLVIAALASHPNIQYVVLAGSDEILPFRRVPDEVYLSNESAYASQAHLKPSALYASLAHGYILTDDYYVDLAPLPWMGRFLYLPDYAIGRLVETPLNMIAVLDKFMESRGVLDADTALVTGYDFLTDAANAVVDALVARGLDPARIRTLISDGWTVADVQDLLLNNPSDDLISINAHFNHWAFGPPVGSPFYSNGILVSYLDGKLVFSTGCHSGLNVDDSISETGQWSFDWPQAFAQEAAWYVGNTGYGYGDSDIVALSEELMRNFAYALGAEASVPVGLALVNAKQAYFLTMGSYGPFDEKIMIEATLYGLPMYRVRVAPFSLPAPGAGTPLQITANRLVDSGVADVVTKEAQLLATTVANGRFYSADGETQFVPYRPIQPKTSMDISYSGQIAHGALLTGGTYQDNPGFDPVISRPLYDLSLYEPQIINEAWYPSKIQTILSLETLGGALQHLTVTPGQFITTSSNVRVIGTERLYTSLAFDIYYSTSQDYTPPIIELVDVTARGTQAPFTAGIAVRAGDPDDPAVPDDGRVKRVLVTWTYTSGDTSWKSVDLQYDSLRGQWFGELPGLNAGEADFIVQVVDGAGNVGLSASKGFFFTPIPVEAGVDQTANEGDTVSFQSSVGQASGPLTVRWDFGDGAIAQGILNPTHVYADNGTYTATLKVTDGKGGSGWDTVQVTVQNVAPAVSVPNQISSQYAAPLQLSGSFSDPALGDQHTYRWDFRVDAVSSPIVTIWGNVNVTINWLEWLSSYPVPGNYIATLTVADDDGGVGQGTTLVTITKSATSTVLTSSVNPSIVGQEVTLTATVSMGLSGITQTPPPTGIVIFADGATVLGTAPLSTSGGVTTASLSTVLSAVGNRNITATYSGDSIFAGSSGNLVQQVVYKFGGFLQPIPGSTYNAGRTIPVKFTLTDFNGLSIGTAVAVVSANGGLALGTATYSSGHYQFNLDTSGLPVGPLTITVSLDDGTTHSIELQLQ